MRTIHCSHTKGNILKCVDIEYYFIRYIYWCVCTVQCTHILMDYLSHSVSNIYVCGQGWYQFSDHFEDSMSNGWFIAYCSNYWFCPAAKSTLFMGKLRQVHKGNLVFAFTRSISSCGTVTIDLTECTPSVSFCWWCIHVTIHVFTLY